MILVYLSRKKSFYKTLLPLVVAHLQFHMLHFQMFEENNLPYHALRNC